MHYTDSRELQRAERFKDVLSRHVEAMQPQLVGAAEAVRETTGVPVGRPACSECGVVRRELLTSPH
ncbi:MULTISPECIES: hypothetical protein [unclassified Streptomyces]|uniref:hypothetical protein n=1 Tax=unclassified Streptomyces TaxID=2593676 RepID=UPI002E10EFCE|nr:MULTISPECIES: hypothetical protein [unclassified Streptomyces]WSR23172.1 hypothetical protein OG573_31255 [Streptomyces sp. NBC_01205]